MASFSLGLPLTQWGRALEARLKASGEPFQPVAFALGDGNPPLNPDIVTGVVSERLRIMDITASFLTPDIALFEFDFSSGPTNMFDGIMELGNISQTTGQNTASTTGIRSKNYTGVLGNTQYTVVRDSNPATIFSARWHFYDDVYAFIGIYSGRTAITPPNCRYARFYVSSFTDTTAAFQIIKGTGAALTGFQFRELAFMVKDTDDGPDICYAYGHAGVGDTIPPNNSATWIHRIERVPIRVANADNIIVSVSIVSAVANLGMPVSGAGIYSHKSGITSWLRRLKPGVGITITEVGDTVVIDCGTITRKLDVYTTTASQQNFTLANCSATGMLTVYIEGVASFDWSIVSGQVRLDAPLPAGRSVWIQEIRMEGA